MLSLIVGLVAGGVGGAVGYQFASQGSGAISALDLPVPGALPAANLPNGSVEQVAQRVTPSVVQLRVHGSRVAAEGSGIVLSADGLLLTNNHVVEPAANGGDLAAVLQDGRSVPVQIVGRAPSFDLAVVRDVVMAVGHADERVAAIAAVIGEHEGRDARHIGLKGHD